MSILTVKHRLISEIRDNLGNLWFKITYLKKQTQFYAFFGPKTAIYPKTKPKQTQFKAKQSQNKPNCFDYENVPIPCIDKAL